MNKEQIFSTYVAMYFSIGTNKQHMLYICCTKTGFTRSIGLVWCSIP